jgi:alpha-tubulin suppressor-like RCC1 family protein
MAVLVALAGAAGMATSVFAGTEGGEAGSSLSAWGFGSSGELGNGEVNNAPSPVAVQGVSCATSAAESYEDSYAVLSDGKVYAWGENSAAEAGGLGNGSTMLEHSATPVEVPGISTATQVSASIPNVFVRLANGTIDGWGNNSDGELAASGPGGDTPRPNIGGLSGVTAVASTDATVLALLSAGKVDAWGNGVNGQLGDGEENTDSQTPVAVDNLAKGEPLEKIKSIAVGTGYALALTQSGEVLAWGGHELPAGLGAGHLHTESDLPIHVDYPAEGEPLKEVTAIAAGGTFALALLKNGTVLAWGANALGELGDGHTEAEQANTYLPVEVEHLSGIVAIAATELDGYALSSAGKVYSWGSNHTGELGTGSAAEYDDEPAQVTALGTSTSALATGADAQHELALGPIAECGAGTGSTGKTNTEPTSSNPGGGTSSTGSTPTSANPSPSPPSPSAAANLILGCTGRKLTLTDVVQRGGRVRLDGAAVSSLAGHKVKILFDGHRQVATATVAADGLFSASAPLPPAKLRGGNGARYLAESGSLRSLDLKLTRRLILNPPVSSAGRVSLTGEVQPPLAKPPAPILVQQQLACGSTKTVARIKPFADGRFALIIADPTGAQAAIYRLSTKVRGNTTTRKLFSTFSLPEPVGLTP